MSELPGADGTGRTFRVTGKAFNGAFNAAGAPVAGTTPTKINGSTTAVTLFASGDKLRIVTGAGNDAVFVGSGAADTTTKGLVVDTGAGRDYAKVQRVANTSAAPLTIKMTQASGNAADAELDADTVILANIITNTSYLNLSTGGGNDRITINFLQGLNGTAKIFTGAGADTFKATNVDVAGVNLNMGSSNHRDVVTVSQLKSGPVNVVLGAGNDLLTLSGSFVTRGTVNGGSGTDKVQLNGFNDVGTTTLVGVEIHNLP